MSLLHRLRIVKERRRAREAAAVPRARPKRQAKASGQHKRGAK